MSNISRSVYQHQVELNKRLLRDIKHLVTKDDPVRSITIKLKWFNRFKKESDFNKLLISLLTKRS